MSWTRDKGGRKAIKDSLIFFGTTGVASGLIFTIAYLVRRLPTKGDYHDVPYDVLERFGKRIALRKPSKFCWLIGLMYAVLFYLSMPILIWRYGKYMSIFLVAIPLISCFAISHLVTSDGSGAILVSIALQTILIRPAVGLYLMTKDQNLRVKTLISRGWKIVGSCNATSNICALEYFKSSEITSVVDDIVEKRNWLSILSGLKMRLSKLYLNKYNKKQQND